MIRALFPITAGATVALLLSVPSAVAALDTPPGAQDTPDAADRPISRAEATAMAGQLFDRLDANHDGTLDAADRKARFEAERARFEAERTARLAARFDAIDTNHDGAISRAEFMAAHAHGATEPEGPMPPPPPPPAMGYDAPPPPAAGLALGYDAPGAPVARGAGQRQPAMARPPEGWAPPQRWGPDRGRDAPPPHWGGPEDARHGPEGPHGRPFGPERGPMLVGLILRTADPQHSGTVSRAAFIAAAQTLFDRADANHDGTVTPAERKAMRRALRQRGDDRYGPDHRRFAPGDAAPPPPPHD